MKNEDYFDYLKDFHLGSMIQEIAGQQQIVASKIVEVLYPSRYQNNADKIFKIKDMDIDDVIRISQLLEHKLLEMISDKYLSHLPFSGIYLGKINASLTLYFETKRFLIDNKEEESNFLKYIHIGDIIKELAKEKGWSEQDLAKKYGCNKTLVNYYFNNQRMKMMPMIRFSNALQINLITEIYLAGVSILHFNGCTIKLNTHNSNPENKYGGFFSIIFKSRMKGE